MREIYWPIIDGYVDEIDDSDEKQNTSTITQFYYGDISVKISFYIFCDIGRKKMCIVTGRDLEEIVITKILKNRNGSLTY